MRTFFELREPFDLIDAEDPLKTYPTDTQLRAAASTLSLCAFLCSVLCATKLMLISKYSLKQLMETKMFDLSL